MTLTLLDRWQHAKSPRTCHLVIVASFRSEEVPAGHLFRSIDPTALVSCVRSSTPTSRLSASRWPDPCHSRPSLPWCSSPTGAPSWLPPSSAAWSRPAPCAQPRGWQIDAGPMGDVQTSRHAALVLSRRFQLFAPDALRFLQSPSSSARSSISILRLPSSASRPARWPPRSTCPASPHPLGDRVRAPLLFTHDKLREALLDGLDRSKRRRLHLAAAERIEALDPDRSSSWPTTSTPPAKRPAHSPTRPGGGRGAGPPRPLRGRLPTTGSPSVPGSATRVVARVDEEFGEVLMLQAITPRPRAIFNVRSTQPVRSRGPLSTGSWATSPSSR